MRKALHQIKGKLRRKYLGTYGIHAVGIRESDNAICIYLDPDSDLDGSEVLTTIQIAASPYQVVLVREEKPRKT